MNRPTIVLLLSSCALAATPDGADLYTKNCAICHEALPPLQNRVAMKVMPPEYIMRALDQGSMRAQGARLDAGERAAIAEFLAGKAIGAQPSSTAGRCPGDAPKNFSGP